MKFSKIIPWYVSHYILHIFYQNWATGCITAYNFLLKATHTHKTKQNKQQTLYQACIFTDYQVVT